LVAIDFAAWLGGALVALVVLRGAGSNSSINDALRVLPLTLAVQTIMGISSGMYRWRWRVGSFGEMGGIATVLGLDVAFLTAVMLGADGRDLPRPFALIAALAAAPLMAAPRALWRVVRDRPGAPDREGVERVLIYGAGRGAALALPSLRDPMSTLLPVGIVDDDPSKRFRSLNGVRVVGGKKDLRDVAHQLRANAVVIAIPSANNELLRQLVDEIERAGLVAYVVPRPGSLELIRRQDALA
jgi:FlaA1/EpsC-like NDP-sugar epimerase